jgi:hypothetical protein
MLYFCWLMENLAGLSVSNHTTDFIGLVMESLDDSHCVAFRNASEFWMGDML